MAKRNRPSQLKREREQKKRERQRKKSEKAAAKRERRYTRESEDEGVTQERPAEPLDRAAG